MSTTNTGGPAFPSAVYTSNAEPAAFGSMSHSGMTMRDYFAAKAMQALLAHHGGYTDDSTCPSAVRDFSEDSPNVAQVAEYAYAQADAMLKARQS